MRTDNAFSGVEFGSVVASLISFVSAAIVFGFAPGIVRFCAPPVVMPPLTSATAARQLSAGSHRFAMTFATCLVVCSSSWLRRDEMSLDGFCSASAS
jgi:hypothetical protein